MSIHYSVMSSTKDTNKFFAKLGPFFASRLVRRELGGYPMNDDETYTWIVAIEKRKFRVVGFVSLESLGEHLVLHELYTVAEFRGQGIAKKLLEKAVHYAEHQNGAALTLTCPDNCMALFKSVGFKLEKKKGSWRVMRKSL